MLYETRAFGLIMIYTLTRDLRRYVLVAASAWMLLVVLSAAWNIHYSHTRAYEHAMVEADAAYSKDRHIIGG